MHRFLKIVKEIEPYKNFVLFRLLAYSGLREGEVYAPRWGDLDFDNNLMSINKSIGRIDGVLLKKEQKIVFLFAQFI